MASWHGGARLSAAEGQQSAVARGGIISRGRRVSGIVARWCKAQRHFNISRGGSTDCGGAGWHHYQGEEENEEDKEEEEDRYDQTGGSVES